ncbi:MAG: acyl-CoA thioesterase [Eubacterium sp.]|jgi:acyl-CoA thioester hydrolase|nr:acyl-CoA thioesterase [Eubacterium sp.]MBR6218376.1 acyl-CoA thioesterase [Eubacterium sp.]
MLKPYKRKINYYETDQMKVVHHSNYARFMEEARLDLMEQVGLHYDTMEEKGIIIPVLDISCRFRYAVHYGDEIVVIPKITKITPVRFSLTYEIRDAKTNEIRCEGTSSHAFVNSEFRPMNIKKAFPEEYKKLEEMLVKEDGGQ